MRARERISEFFKVYLHETAVKDDDLALICKLTRVRNLFLGKTRIGDAGLKHLQTSEELQTLSLNSTQVTDAGLESLSKLTKLKTLNLQETQVTAGGLSRLENRYRGQISQNDCSKSPCASRLDIDVPLLLAASSQQAVLFVTKTMIFPITIVRGHGH